MPIRLKSSEIDILFNYTKSIKGLKGTINLKDQFVIVNDNNKFKFDINSSLKIRLLEGLDDIALTLKKSDSILRYEKIRSKINPWLFKDI